MAFNSNQLHKTSTTLPGKSIQALTCRGREFDLRLGLIRSEHGLKRAYFDRHLEKIVLNVHNSLFELCQRESWIYIISTHLHNIHDLDDTDQSCLER
jgi:hypothetical protein